MVEVDQETTLRRRYRGEDRLESEEETAVCNSSTNGSAAFVVGSGEGGNTLQTEVPVLRWGPKISIAENLTVICNEANVPMPDLAKESVFRHSLSPTPTLLPQTFYSYIWQELTRGYTLKNDQTRYTEKRRKLYAFLRIPIHLEKFLFYGQLQCIDAFLFLFAFLPLRFVMSILGFMLRVKEWSAASTSDTLKVLIILCSSVVMHKIDTSVVYHEVRMQGVIKLYIFYNMLEVADRLFSSLGQDILDALFLTANETKIRSVQSTCLTGVHFLIAVIYATTHAFLVLLQATTLNVAFNSHTQALLAIMMSNNFVELKGAVFKKFAKANLFQMACSDVRERFHIMVLLFVVIVRNMAAVNWSYEHLLDMLPDVLMVFGAELLVDWFKHAFITKFNEINANVYDDFTITLAFDAVKTRNFNAFSDYSDQVSRRMGFIPIPLSVMLVRIISQTFTLNWSWIAPIFLIWVLLVLIKVCNGIVMLGQACKNVTVYKDLQARTESELYKKKMLEKKSKSAPSSPRMSLIDFTDVLHQPSGPKGFTASDVISHWDVLQQIKVSERRTTEDDREERPRRAISMANLQRPRRDTSEPPSSGQESAIEKKGDDQSRDEGNQASPKKKISTMPGCEDLDNVTAYQMLSPEQGVERIE